MVRLPGPLRPLFPYVKPLYVSATRAAAPFSIRLSQLYGGQLPTSVSDTLEQAAVTSGGRCVQARAPEVIRRPATVPGLPVEMPLTDSTGGESVGRVAVAELPGGRVLGPHRAVITGAGSLVQEVSRYFGTTQPWEHPLFLAPFPPSPLCVDGRVGVLASRGDSNYYHFLMDVLPRLAVVEQTPDVTAPDRWYVPCQLRFQRELLELLGVGPEQRVDATQHPHVRAELLVVPGPPAMSEMNPPWVVDWLRERLLPRLDGPGHARFRRRIYITRGPSANNRSVKNEAAVRELLGRRGFDLIDPGHLAVRDQIAAFANAELIVAPHGAALANLAFAHAGSAVIELFPAGCLLPDYWRLACGVEGLRYRYLSAPGRPPRLGRASALVRDIDVDLAGLNTLLDELNS